MMFRAKCFSRLRSSWFNDQISCDGRSAIHSKACLKESDSSRDFHKRFNAENDLLFAPKAGINKRMTASNKKCEHRMKQLLGHETIIRLNKRLTKQNVLCFAHKKYSTLSLFNERQTKNKVAESFDNNINKRLLCTRINDMQNRPLLKKQNECLVSLCKNKSSRHIFMSTQSLSESALKQRAALKASTLQKLARIQSKADINSFPLLSDRFSQHNQVSFSETQVNLLESLKESTGEYSVQNAFYPSVTTVLSSTMSPQSLVALEKWKKLKVAQLGEDGFKSYQQNILNRGKSLHSNIRFFLTGKAENIIIQENIINLWKSLQSVLPTISEVRMCETPVHHPFLCYKGIVDCVAVYENQLAIIEWKTSEKLRPTLKHIYDTPLQAVAYLGAINFDANRCLDAKEIVMIYAYEDGSDAQVHHINTELCHEYWDKWLLRLKEYWNIFLNANK